MKAISLKRGWRLALVAASALLFSACSDEAQQQLQRPTAMRQREAHEATRSLIISAAASTKEAVETIAEKFTADGQIDVKVNSGPSSGLASQILAGAPADLFLSANQQWADEVSKHGEALAMARLLTNDLVIVVPSANPGAITDPKDFLSPSVKKIALAGEKVPAGMYADQALTKLKLLEPLANAGKIVRGQDVRVALSYVERGEAEAGIVYSTDVAAASGLKVAYVFDPKLHDEIVYVLVLLNHGSDKPEARNFYEFLQSPDADMVLRQFGFRSMRELNFTKP